MRCSALVVVVMALVGCDPIEAPVLTATGQATQPIELLPPGPQQDGTHYHWDFAESPDGSSNPSPIGEPIATFTPDRRGEYLLELSVNEGVANDLAARYEVSVFGIAPLASMDVSSDDKVGSEVTADGGASSSAEKLSLVFSWRLATRPADSAASLASTSGAATSFTPDVLGEYVLELDVFDGELWNDVPATSTVHVE